MRELKVILHSPLLEEPLIGTFYEDEKIRTIIKWSTELVKEDSIFLHIKPIED